MERPSLTIFATLNMRMNLYDKTRHLYYCKAKIAVNKLLFMENVSTGEKQK